MVQKRRALATSDARGGAQTQTLRILTAKGICADETLVKRGSGKALSAFSRRILVGERIMGFWAVW